MATREEIIAKLDEEEARFLERTSLADARVETRRLLDALIDEQLATTVPGAPWMDGTIGGVLLTNAYHQIQHWKWVAEGPTTVAAE